MFFFHFVTHIVNTVVFSDPLEQFDVFQVPITTQPGVFSFALTNIMLQLILFLFIFFCFLSFCLRNPFSGYFLAFQRLLKLVAQLVLDTLKYKNQRYFPFFFFLFLFILINNIASLIPFTYTVTSSFVVTFFLSTIVFGAVTFIGCERFGLRFANLFYPHNVPFSILHFLIIIEFFSYCMRWFSLAIRLFANMMSGHTLMKILFGFSWLLIETCSVWSLAALIAWGLVLAITILELLIAFLQSYVFVFLSLIYLDSVVR